MFVLICIALAAPMTIFFGALIVGAFTGEKHGIKIKGIINDKF